MNDLFYIGVSAVVAIAGVIALIGFYVYGGGVNDNLANAKVGEVYNFQYEQPYHGDPNRFLAKVLDVQTLTDWQINRLNNYSRYRRNDPVFKRTKHLVTCKTSDGNVRHFYAERAKNVRRSLFGGMLIKSGVAAMFF